MTEKSNMLLLEIYKQCHDHLRETDKKRDQLIAFYLIVVSLLYGGLDKLDKYGQLKDLIAIIIGVVGVAVVLTMVHYRKWHDIHLNTAVVIHYIIKENGLSKDTNIKDIWKKQVDIRNGKVLNPIGSVEASIFYVFLIISFLPWCIPIYDGYGLYNVRSYYLAVAINFMFFWAIPFCIYSCIELNKADRPDKKEELWAFRVYRTG